MFRKIRILVICIFVSSGIHTIQGQEKLYKNEFYLGDVKLLDGPEC